MLLQEIPIFLSDFFDFLDTPAWRAWPFNAGYGDHLLPAIARMTFVTLIFGVIIVFLRALYGPKGIFRDKEMDREAAEERKAERAELKAKLANGEISEAEFRIKIRNLQEK